MKILTLHVDYINFKPLKKALKTVGELSEKDKKEIKVGESLVVMIAVEKGDSVESSVGDLINNIKDISSQLKIKKVVLYPYAHLSSSLSNPDIAIEVLNKTEKLLSKEFDVIKAPFGYYKEFELKVKGHPLSELSREIVSEKDKKVLIENFDEKIDEKTNALKAEEKIKSQWYIMTPDGKMQEVDKFDYKSHKNLKKFAFYEKSKSRKAVKEPAHIKTMKALELVDYEPASDSGNFRYYPKGRLIKSLIEEYVTKRVIDYGGMEVETPIMYNIQHPALSSYLQKFPARQYQIESDKKKFFLRFSACFGQFLMAKDAPLSYKNLPFRIYEMTRYSFRKEQSGELSGLRRLRSFTMPDVHALCSDLEQSMEEYKTRFDLCIDVLDKIGISLDDLELGIRFTKDFYNKNKKFVEYLVKRLGKPALVEMWNERAFYFVLKYEFNFVDSVDKAAALSTDQIDVENAERYGIKFKDKDNIKKYPLILHCSPSGAVERVIYALLEKAEINKSHSLPYWLCPTQLRIASISEKFNEKAISLAEEFNQRGVRTDVDDRNITLPKKISDSESEWIPYVVVIGEKEAASGKIALRTRNKKGIEILDKEELFNLLKKQQEDMPWKSLPLPKLLSKRPIFVG
ncbi:threonine--tRNA ligase [Patescibacteria group bacterium]|nr:threonine--tRNA ligase [Patescibacteria group bacterium]